MWALAHADMSQPFMHACLTLAEPWALEFSGIPET